VYEEGETGEKAAMISSYNTSYYFRDKEGPGERAGEKLPWGPSQKKSVLENSEGPSRLRGLNAERRITDLLLESSSPRRFVILPIGRDK